MTEPSFDPPEEGPKMMPEKVKHVRRSMTPIRMLKAVEAILDDGELDDGAKISDLIAHLKDLIINEALVR